EDRSLRAGDGGSLPPQRRKTSPDRGRAPANPPISLRKFEADITRPQHDQVRGHIVELEGLDVGERPRSLEAGNGGNSRMRSDIDEYAIARQHARSAVIEMHLERFRRDEVSVSHDQLGAGRLVIVQMRLDFALDHVALTLDDGRRVGGDGGGYHAEASTLARQMCDPGTPNFVLAGQTGDVWTRAADPATLDDGSSPSRLRHMPGQQLATLAAAKDQGI